jgi:hypothetical protein
MTEIQYNILIESGIHLKLVRPIKICLNENQRVKSVQVSIYLMHLLFKLY